jgi:protein-tyrosine phosphatase
MGFPEKSPEQVRENLELDGETIISRVNGTRLGCGWLETPSLAQLRVLDRTAPEAGPSRVSEVIGDSRALHAAAENAGSLFQAASQFNLLEMTGPGVTPEKGVGIYEHDRTQGPACAIACGGGTIYRNYFAKVGGGLGQTHDRQIDCLADLGAELGADLWNMRNGYALVSEGGLALVNERLGAASGSELDELRGLLRVGVQHEVEVLDAGHKVTQVYGSALPVAYGGPAAHKWERFARLVLEASYEATLRLARIWQTTPVFLTFLGGGVFGNASEWIEDAIVRAIEAVPGLDVRLVSYGGPSEMARRIIERCGSGPSLPKQRTSHSHPIRVDLVQAGPGPDVGMTFAPGKFQINAMTGSWHRSLEADLSRLARVHEVTDLVCLLEDEELDELRIEALVERASAHGITVHRLPIRDQYTPAQAELESLLAQVPQWREQGRRVVFHCKGGLGRAGTVAACCLIDAGIDAQEAIVRVRAARAGAIENPAQERFVREFEAYVRAR